MMPRLRKIPKGTVLIKWTVGWRGHEVRKMEMRDAEKYRKKAGGILKNDAMVVYLEMRWNRLI